MKPRYFLLLPFLSLLAASCQEHEWSASPQPSPSPGDIVSPVLVVTTDSIPFNGLLEALPCIYNTSTYFGNYTSSGSRLALPGYYYYSGDTLSQATPIRLPIGNYTMVYWGYPTYFSDSIGAAQPPQLTIGTNLAAQAFSLYPIRNDTTYQPSQELVFAVQNVDIGTDTLTAYLSRVTAMLNVSVSNTNANAITSVDSMWVMIGNISYNINAYTAAASNPTKTVAVGLNANSTSTAWTCSNISLHPSAANPPMTLFILLNNGKQYSYAKNLSVTLGPATLTTVTILLTSIISTENQPGGFTIESWNVQSDTLNVPAISRIRNLNRTF